MLFPIRCFSCNCYIALKYNRYKLLCKDHEKSEVFKKLNINRCRMYITGNNLFTVTKYPGTNPDISSRGLFSGFDNSTFPVPIEAFVGLQLSF